VVHVSSGVLILRAFCSESGVTIIKVEMDLIALARAGNVRNAVHSLLLPREN